MSDNSGESSSNDIIRQGTMEEFEAVLYTGSPRSKTVEAMIKRLRDENRSLLVENQQARWRIDILESQVAVLEEEKKALVMKLDEATVRNT